jgi:hypothetical protein
MRTLDWTVLVGIDREQVADIEAVSDAMIEALEGRDPAIGTAGKVFGARFTLGATSVNEALELGLALFMHAAAAAGIADPLLLEIHAQEWEAFEAELDRDRSLELVGVAEVAEMLDVSKQRVTQLARDPRFPEAWQLLASGPVWAKAAVQRFLEQWDRRPGPKSQAAVHRTVEKLFDELAALGYAPDVVAALVTELGALAARIPERAVNGSVDYTLASASPAGRVHDMMDYLKRYIEAASEEDLDTVAHLGRRA